MNYIYGRSKIREHLEEPNRHVKNGEDLIEQQEERVQEMARDSHQTQIHIRNFVRMRQICAEKRL